MIQAEVRNVEDGSHLRESALGVKEAVADLAGEATRYTRNRLSSVRESAGAMLTTVKSKAGDYNESFVGYVGKNPYKSLAIAAGIGLVAGFLLRRR